MKDPSRIYRWLLLVASVVTIVYLVGAAVRENYLAQWRTVQHEYRNILRGKKPPMIAAANCWPSSASR